MLSIIFETLYVKSTRLPNYTIHEANFWSSLG